MPQSPRRTIKFLDITILLPPKVFEPRLETEFWVQRAISELKVHSRGKRRIKILDIFTGTGCIGLAFLANFKEAKVDFTDISPRALLTVKANLRINKIRVKRARVFRSNLFGGLRRERGKIKYDVILANPPYIAIDRIAEVEEDVLKREPNEALFAGRDGLDWIRKFFQEVDDYLKIDGVIYLEFDPLQKNEIEKILRGQGFKFSFQKDQFKKYRWLRAENYKGE